MPHLLFVTSTGRLESSSIKRVFDLSDHLSTLGYRVSTLSYRWEWLWKTRHRADTGSSPHRFLLRSLNATRLAQRLYLIRDGQAKQRFQYLVKTADVVIVLRTSLDEDWRRILETSSRVVVYDVDDAVWMTDQDGFTRMLKLADAVVAGNSFLANHASRLHSDVAVIPTSVRLDRYEHVSKTSPNGGAVIDNGVCVVGWIGSPSTTKYLDLLIDPLERLGREFKVVLRIVGSGAASLPEFRNVKLDLHPEIPYDPVRFVPSFDIGVMPLHDTEWERGKCAAKLLEYMAAGIPTISSAVGENTRIVEDRVNGLLASTDEEWFQALKLLAGDSQSRKRIGSAGREQIRSKYSSEVVASRWHEHLNRFTLAHMTSLETA